MILSLFVFFYFLIVLEHVIKISKTPSALILGMSLWLVVFLERDVSQGFLHHLQEISEIIFFILAAMLIVETIYEHKGFDLLTQGLYHESKKITYFKVLFLTFFLSSLLDNLTTTIVMITLTRNLFTIRDERLLVSGMIVLAANFGGVWSPMGDVTTTMLWLGGQISPLGIIKKLFIPTFLAFLIGISVISFFIKGTFQEKMLETPGEVKKDIFILGLLALIATPALKIIFGIRPLVAIYFNLSILWFYLELRTREEETSYIKVGKIFKKLDFEGLFFFFGLLLAVALLQEQGYLKSLALFLKNYFSYEPLRAALIGLISAVVDNVPVTSAVQKMYSLKTYPKDHPFWELLVFCVGVGGNLLVIGSVAGVIAMNMVKIDFFWYLRKITPVAFLTYLLGILFYMAVNHYY